jgi:hypothetical protein
MSSRAGRAQRAGRGVAAATVATFVTTVAHSSVAAELPSLLNIVLALCVAAPVCVLLAGRALSWSRLSLAVVLSQAAFHALLSLDLRGGGASPVGHHGAGVFLDAAASNALPATHVGHAPWMWGAHATAAVLTILALGMGERALRAIAGFLAATFRALRPLAPHPVPVSAPAPAVERPLTASGIAVLSVMRHRGPPLAA